MPDRTGVFAGASQALLTMAQVLRASGVRRIGVEDPEVFAERISFVETRDYVRIIQRNEDIYRALYGPQMLQDTGIAPPTTSSEISAGDGPQM